MARFPDFPDLDRMLAQGDEPQYGPRGEPMEGPFAPEFYDARDELRGDEDALAMLRRGYAPPAPRGTFTPERRGPLRMGPVSVPGESIDALIASLHEGVSRGRPRGFGANFTRGLVRGAIAPQVQDMRERADRNEMGARRAESMEREAAAGQGELRRAALRMAMEGRAKRQADARKPMVPVPAWMAQALQRDDLIGQSVPEDEWTRMRGMFDDVLQLRTANRLEREKPVKEESRLSRSSFLSAVAKKSTLMRRQMQLEAKLAAPRPKETPAFEHRQNVATWTEALDKVTADMEGVEAILNEAPASWMPEVTGGSSAGGPGTAKPAPSAAPASGLSQAAPAAADTTGEVSKLKREAEGLKRELKATGALSAQRRTQAQSRLTAINKRLMALGDGGLNALPNKQGLGVAAPRKPAGSVSVSPAGGASPGAAKLSAGASQLVEQMRSGGIATRADAARYVEAARAWMKENGVPEAEVLGAFQ